MKTKRKAFTNGQEATRQRLLRAADGDLSVALNDAIQTLHESKHEHDRLWELIKKQRILIQRLTFPALYPPDIPIGKEAAAEIIYGVAEEIVAMMKREDMADNYEVTFNSMELVASHSTAWK